MSEKLPVGVLLGTDVPILSTLLGVPSLPANKTDDVLVVTWAQAQRQLEEEILQREKEVQSGSTPNPSIGFLIDVEASEDCGLQSIVVAGITTG